MSKRNKIAGYDKNVVNEQLGVKKLETLLLGTYRLIPYFTVNDKTPNYDGYFELCDEVIDDNKITEPKSRFNVQIKTVNSDYKNKNKRDHLEYKYKHQFDTKILNATLKEVTKDPTIFFIVDPINSKIFWKYLSEEFCMANVEYKNGAKDTFILYFSDEDEITDTEAFIDNLIVISSTHKKHLEESKDNNRSEILLLTESEDIRKEAQDAWDYINNMFSGSFKFIKDAFYPNTWKFGISYGKEKSWSQVGIYRIEQGDNNELIKKYDRNEKGLLSSYYTGIRNLLEVTKDYVKGCVNEFFSRDQYIAQCRYIPDVAIEELIFEDIDNQYMANNNCGNEVYYGIPTETIELDFYDELVCDGVATPRTEFFLEEMRRRGKKQIQRPWTKVLKGVFGDIKSEHIVNPITGMKEQITYIEPVHDRSHEEVFKENRTRFCQGIRAFVEASLERFDKSFVSEIDADTLVREIEKIRVDLLPEYSWYKLWYVCFGTMSLKILGEEPSMIAMNYITVK
ncbi:protein of unknown function [Oribacterium sp. KHPX15]|nr:protein of unknown function [Oribacterium sp. KHPX15]